MCFICKRIQRENLVTLTENGLNKIKTHILLYLINFERLFTILEVRIKFSKNDILKYENL